MLADAYIHELGENKSQVGAGNEPARENWQVTEQVIASTLLELLAKARCPVLEADLPTLDECAGEADVDDVAELVDRHVGDQADVGEPRRVDNDVDRAGLLEQPLHRILVRDVDGRGGVGAA